MLKRSSKKKRPVDLNKRAWEIVQEATEGRIKLSEKPRKNPAAVELGRLGGLKGGKARAERLTAEERREIARKAARARWDKQKS